MLRAHGACGISGAFDHVRLGWPLWATSTVASLVQFCNDWKRIGEASAAIDRCSGLQRRRDLAFSSMPRNATSHTPPKAAKSLLSPMLPHDGARTKRAQRANHEEHERGQVLFGSRSCRRTNSLCALDAGASATAEVAVLHGTKRSLRIISEQA